MIKTIEKYLSELALFKKNKYEINYCNHKNIPKLKDNKMGIYIYIYDNEFLKIGKAWTNSDARWMYQHYNYNSSKSNLAASIVQDKDFCIENNIIKKDRESVKEWIKQNTTRINIIIERTENYQEDLFYLNLMEAWLHYKCKPKYEGHTLK